MPRPLTEISANEFSAKFGSLIGGLFVFYLLLFGNFTGDLLNCQIQGFVKNNKYIRHLIGFFVLYFFVNLASPNVNWNAGIKFGFTMALYLLFLLSNRSEKYIMLTNIALLALVYILQIVRDTDQGTMDDENSSEEEKQNASEELERIKIVQIVVACIIGVAIIFGFIMHVGRRKLEYGEDFDFAKMLFDTSVTCSNDIPQSRNWFDVFKAAFEPPPILQPPSPSPFLTITATPLSPSNKRNAPVLAKIKMEDAEIRNETRKLMTVFESDMMQGYIQRFIEGGGKPLMKETDKTTPTASSGTPMVQVPEMTRLEARQYSNSSLPSDGDSPSQPLISYYPTPPTTRRATMRRSESVELPFIPSSSLRRSMFDDQGRGETAA